MMKLLIRAIGIVLCCSVQTAWAQSDKYTGKQKDIYWDAENLMTKGDYIGAIEGFATLVGVDKDYNTLFFNLGKSYYGLKNYSKALPYLRKGKEDVKEAYYLLAKIHLFNEELDSAEYFVKRYEKKARFSKDKISNIEIAQLKKSIENANSFWDNPEDVEIINLGESINSTYDEYVPLITADESLLLFTSRRDQKNLDPLGVPFEDVYSAVNTGGRFEWSKAELIKGEVNTKKHDACVGLSPDGNILYVFRTHENVITGDLYESKRTETGWSKPVKMSENINDPASTEPSASISLDGLTFYFSSDRDGGYGGFDIYRVKRLPSGEWSLPLNLGPTINTPFDEDAPFIHPNGTSLYFSSKGHNNMGGYDIFKAEMKSEGWKEPQNLGVPTNTTRDDIYFSITGNEKHGYYSTEKSDGLGGQDIYVIDFLEKSLHQSVISSTVLLEGKPIDAEITLFDNESADMVGVFVPNLNNGKFIILVNPNKEYELLVEGEGFERHTQTLSFDVEELSQRQTLSINLTPSKGKTE